jgi:hypothetical protein
VTVADFLSFPQSAHLEVGKLSQLSPIRLPLGFIKITPFILMANLLRFPKSAHLEVGKLSQLGPLHLPIEVVGRELHSLEGGDVRKGRPGEVAHQPKGGEIPAKRRGVNK